MFGLGGTELIIVAVIVFLIFGAKRLPDIGKGLGGAIREFRKVKKEISLEETSEADHKADRTESKESGSAALEEKVVGKVLEKVPGVKKAMDVKKKAEKIKEIIK